METAKDIATIIGTAAAIVIGFLGLKTWRIQLRSTADTELARRILVGLYKIKASVAFIRRPLREGITLPEGASISDQNAWTEAVAKQYQEEWNKLADERTELLVSCIEAQAVWDRDFLRHLTPLNVCLGELLDNITDYFEAKRQTYRDPDYHPAKTRRILFGTGGANDEYAQELNRIILDIDEKVRVKFERESFWHFLV
ncbi:MAG: hypothetical protein DMF63_00530 [Acidobacteria bacterium]|nr:MAG: hypothetical protein DMF63_00530 [Acidobacteriota bacterium]